jgi:hypothetical protein
VRGRDTRSSLLPLTRLAALGTLSLSGRGEDHTFAEKLSGRAMAQASL